MGSGLVRAYHWLWVTDTPINPNEYGGKKRHKGQLGTLVLEAGRWGFLHSYQQAGWLGQSGRLGPGCQSELHTLAVRWRKTVSVPGIDTAVCVMYRIRYNWG